MVVVGAYQIGIGCCILFSSLFFKLEFFLTSFFTAHKVSCSIDWFGDEGSACMSEQQKNKTEINLRKT